MWRRSIPLVKRRNHAKSGGVSARAQVDFLFGKRGNPGGFTSPDRQAWIQQ
jgi:hypothetical protein